MEGIKDEQSQNGGMLEGWNEEGWVRRLKLKCYDGQIEKAWGQGRQRRELLAEYLTSSKKARKGEGQGGRGHELAAKGKISRLNRGTSSVSQPDVCTQPLLI